MSLEERLNAMGIEANATGDDFADKQNGLVTPKVDNLLVLLVQGLQSNDSKMLNVNIYIYIKSSIFSYIILFFIFFFLIYKACPAT